MPLTHWQSAVHAAVNLLPNGAGFSLTNPGIGWLSANGGNYGLLDHAGAYHISMAAGVSSLVLTFFMGKASQPVHGSKNTNVALAVFFGMAGYLTFGDPNSLSGGSAPALVNTFMSVGAAVITGSVWQIIYNLTQGHGFCAPTEENIILSMHYGLVAVTSGASLIAPMWAAFFGFFVVSLCFFMNFVFAQLQLEGLGANSIFSIHFLGAAFGAGLTGLFANPSYSSTGPAVVAVSAGSLYGNYVQLGRQVAGVTITFLVAGFATFITYAFVLLVSKAFGNPTLTLAADEPLVEGKEVDAVAAPASGSATTEV